MRSRPALLRWKPARRVITGGRVAHDCGREVRLIPQINVKVFVKWQKNYSTDAAAVGKAALRSNMHFVAVKSTDYLARRVAFRAHQCFVGQRTQLINALRGHLAEFRLVIAKGPASIAVFALQHPARDTSEITQIN